MKRRNERRKTIELKQEEKRRQEMEVCVTRDLEEGAKFIRFDGDGSVDNACLISWRKSRRQSVLLLTTVNVRFRRK